MAREPESQATVQKPAEQREYAGVAFGARA